MYKPVPVYGVALSPLIVLGLKVFLSESPDYEWRSDYATLTEFVEGLQGEDSAGGRLLVMDYVGEHSEANASDVLREIRRTYPNLRVLFLLRDVAHDLEFVKALRAGADGYLSQFTSTEVLHNAMDALMNDKAFIEPRVTPAVLAELRQPTKVTSATSPNVEITPREQALMQLAADGLNNHKIAVVLGLQEKTVRNLWSTLFHKTGLSDRTQAVLWAIRSGYAQIR